MKTISNLFTFLKPVNLANTRSGNNRRPSLIILPLLLGGLFTVLLTACGESGSNDGSRTGPPSISDFRAIPGDETLMLSWTNPKSDNITGLNITWFDKSNPGDVKSFILNSANALSSEAAVNYTIRDLDNDNNYEVTVVVIYGDGRSAPSKPESRRPGVNTDGDDLPDSLDNCPSMSNSGQDDADNDGIGDVCDPEPNNPAEPLAPLDGNNRLTQICISSGFDRGNETFNTCSNLTYNDAQQVIRADLRTNNGSLLVSTTYNYYADGQPTQEVYYNFTAVISEPLASNIIYDISGQQPTEVIFASESRFFAELEAGTNYRNYTYNAAGQLIDENESNLFRSNNFTYNAAGQLTRFDSYSGPSEDFTGHTNLTYNAAGQLTGVNDYDSGGNLTESSTYIYNAAEQVNRTNDYDFDGTLVSYNTYTYNSAGQLTREDNYGLPPGDDDDAVVGLREFAIYIYGGDN